MEYLGVLEGIAHILTDERRKKARFGSSAGVEDAFGGLGDSQPAASLGVKRAFGKIALPKSDVFDQDYDDELLPIRDMRADAESIAKEFMAGQQRDGTFKSGSNGSRPSSGSNRRRVKPNSASRAVRKGKRGMGDRERSNLSKTMSAHALKPSSTNRGRAKGRRARRQTTVK